MSPDESSEPSIIQPSPSDALTAPDPAAAWKVPSPANIGDPANASPASPLYPSMAGAPPPPPLDSVYPSFSGTPRPRRQWGTPLALLGMGGIGALFVVITLLILQRTGIQNWFFQTNNTAGTTTLVVSSPPRGLTSVPLVTTTPGMVTTVTTNPSHTPIASTATAIAATATPIPTATAVAIATPIPPLTVSITCLTPPVQNRVTLCVQTAAGATLTIATVDCDGKIDPAAPTSGTADSAGMYTNSWKPRRPTGGCHSATVTVTSTLNQQQSQTQGTLMIGP